MLGEKGRLFRALDGITRLHDWCNLVRLLSDDVCLSLGFVFALFRVCLCVSKDGG